MDDKIRFAKLITLVTSFGDEPLTGYQIAQIDTILSEDGGTFRIDPGSLKELLSCMLMGKKLDAIRHYRALTGAPLKDSKEAVEAFWTYTDKPKEAA